MTINRHSSWIIAEFFFIFSVISAVMFAILSDTIAETLKLNQSQLGQLSGVYFIVFALSQLGIGISFSLISPRIILVGTAVLSTFGAILFASSESFGFALFARIIMGMGLSSTFVGVLYIVGENYPDKFALMSSFSQSIANLGAASMSILSAYIPFLVTFREPFLIMSGLFLLTAILLYLILSKPSNETTISRPKLTIKEDFTTAVSSKQFWAALLYYSGLFGSLIAYADLWNIQFEMKYFQHTAAASTVMNSMVILGATLGGITAGLWADRSGYILPARAFGVMSVILFSLCLLINVSDFIATGMMFLLGFGLGGSILGLTAIRESIPTSAIPMGTSLIVTTGFIFVGIIQPIIGSVIGTEDAPFLQYNLVDYQVINFGSYQRGILVLLAFALIATIASFCFRKKTSLMLLIHNKTWEY